MKQGDANEQILQQAESWVETIIRRLLKTPLEALSITKCQLSDPDWNDLSGVSKPRPANTPDAMGQQIEEFQSEPLVILLENAAATLETLNLQDCGITNSQLQAILPVLSC
ncbi:hypothetical protein GHT09_018689 [Marmota monax]|uniref:Uncharacterized protein n=1 Tax=Marmota monax TaxID=9995 RepID=A0A834UTW8_MARMO|nr:hypothetical protein GHT09_018689 [Marmota monax]